VTGVQTCALPIWKNIVFCTGYKDIARMQWVWALLGCAVFSTGTINMHSVE